MTSRLFDWRILLALFCCLSLWLAPAIAEARGGHSFGGRPSSMGSRGARTWDNNSAQPFGRSATPQPGPQTPGFATPGAGYGGSFFQRHPFLTGLGGGLIGSWLFGHSGLAADGHNGTSGFGVLFELVLIGILVFIGVRLFRRWRAANGGGWGGGGWQSDRSARLPRSAGAAAAPTLRQDRGRDINLADADLDAFQSIHRHVQEAWSSGDLDQLRQLMTPEMLGYFSQELTRNASRGVQNHVSDVRLVKGELTEAWDEGDLQYATALMRWTALDYFIRAGRSPGDPDYIAGGDPSRPTEAEEMWTFVRRRGGDWLLSAIQQV
jgi:predicted lipid-binding transport protein (Tim44 family)